MKMLNSRTEELDDSCSSKAFSTSRNQDSDLKQSKAMQGIKVKQSKIKQCKALS